ncbi:MAG: pyridoxamine 5'-phosphate oxidase [Bacteroidia bacterium]|nr:pyridoxamine 5'-phosphate oxidase [Bacteroidia bacterium]
MEDINKYIKELRKDFSGEPLDERDVDKNPANQFDLWFKEAVKANANEPNAMVLSTVNEEHKPSARIVLLREYGIDGFAFFTNFQSRKGMEIEKNPYGCLTFFWPELERQIRIEGKIIQHTKEASDTYFNSRPRTSRIGAWSSPQSKKIKDRTELENLVTDFDKKYPTENVPRPEFWGGYLLKPDYFEFWQGRPSRLHDRLLYSLQENNEWRIERLAP